MDNDVKFTRGWRALIIAALALSVAAGGIRIRVGGTTVGTRLDDPEGGVEQSKKEKELEERTQKMETYLYHEVAPIVAAEKTAKEKQSDSGKPASR